MFTSSAQRLVDRAKDYAFSRGSSDLDLVSLLASFCGDRQLRILLAELLNITPDAVAGPFEQTPEPVNCPGRLPLQRPVRALLDEARTLAEKVPDRADPGLIGIRHLACAAAMSAEACAQWNCLAIARDTALAKLGAWHETDLQVPGLDELTDRLRSLRSELLEKVFGQNHAVHAFIEGLFNAEVTAASDTERKAPRALFVFVGPPGVGKTFLATLGAAALDRPFKRFDMSAFAGHHQHEQLVGAPPMYKGAQPGMLTGFVEQNPNAILLFDEIDKAHLSTIHLFLQILDAGVLEDKHHEREVSFRDTIVIFTSNAGKKLYENPDLSSLPTAGSSFHRKTILDALENEKDPHTGQPFFPAAICSRMATGYPVLFNHLGVTDLERVVRAELARVAQLLERQYFKPVEFGEQIPMCLIMREGGRVDARTLRSQAEHFVKNEIFNFCQLFKAERLAEVLEQIKGFRFELEQDEQALGADIRALFAPPQKATVLVVGDPEYAHLLEDHVGEVMWQVATSAEDALAAIGRDECDMVLLDLWISDGAARGAGATIHQFDHIPGAARGLAQGQELLRKIHERVPEMPVVLLSIEDPKQPCERRMGIDDELLMACVRAGGARGVLTCRFLDNLAEGWREHRDRFGASLLEQIHKLHSEKVATRLGLEHKVLSFDTAPVIDDESGMAVIRLRNLSLSRALSASDAGEVMDEVDRPQVGFDDVIGADDAKEELRFFIDFLRNPRRFAATGLKPPKGVLLHGPPGTGKTMLARAMAGESDVAFVSATASSFVTIWQGSGPQSVRDLFARARRYAPAIIFIDEIDAIGKVRTGGPGGQAEENTLNALLTELDGFTGPSPTRPVFVLAATNFRVDADNQDAPERSARTLDPALVRRFSRTILVDLPDRMARQRYLNMRLKDRPSCSVSDAVISLVAERSSGMSIANLEAIIETAARGAVRSGRELDDQLLEEALETTQFGEARPRTDEEKLQTARHEAGHALLYWHSGWWPTYVTIVARGGHGGYMAPCSKEVEKGVFTRQQLLASIRVCLAGRAAETLCYGAEEGLTTGASGDLERATDMARRIICLYGMDDGFGLLATPELMKYQVALSSPVYLQINEAAGRILREQMQRTVAILKEHRSHFDVLVDALVKNDRLAREDLEKVLPASPLAMAGASAIAKGQER